MGKRHAGSGALAIGLILLIPLSATANIVITADPVSNLSDVVVGDTITIDAVASSTTPGEHFAAFPDVHVFWTSFDMQLDSFNFAPTLFDDLTTDPVIAVATFLAVAPSTQTVFFGWPDCTGLPSVTTGCAITNDEAIRPLDSNHVTFNIAVPEPGTVALLGVGLVALGVVRRTRSARSKQPE